MTVSAQTNKETIPLIDFLKQIEKQHNVSFTYADANVKNTTIAKLSTELSLKDLLNYISKHTNLYFETLNDKILIIKKEEDKKELKSFKTQYLEQVVISNYLTKGISLSNDGSTNIKPESFGILPGLIEPDVLQTVQSLPGVISVDERVSNVNIRGGTHDQNLMLWDGIKMYQSGHFFGLISAFNPYLTETVSVSKNGTSAMYGDGVSSVIDMQSSNTISEKSIGGGGFNFINGDAYAKVPLSKKMEIQLSARRSLTDLIATPTYDQYFKRIFQDTDLTNNQNNNSVSKDERFYFYDATVKFLYDLSKKDKIRANFLNVFNNLNYNEQSRVNNVDEELNSSITQSNIAASVDYTRDWNSQFTTSIQAYASKYNLDATNFDVLNNQRLIQENQVYDNGIKTQINYQFNDNLKLKSGYQFSEVGVSNLEDVNNPVFRSYIKEVIRTHSIFSELDFSSNSKGTLLKFGVRGNYFEKFSKTRFEPRFSFNQRFLSNFRFELLGELKSQTTSQIIDLQNDFLGIEKRRWVLANNNDIPIIESKQISTGVRFNKDRWLLSVDAFIKKVDGINTRSQGFQNQFQFVNTIGNYQIKGLDFLINKQFDRTSIWFSYSYSKNDYMFKDLNLGNTFPNNVDITHALTFAGTYSTNKFKFALGFNWRTGKPYTIPDTTNPNTNNTINYASPNSSNIEDYLRTDFSTTYTFKVANNTNAIAGFSIWNLLNKENIINTYYIIDSDDNISKIENSSLGITPNFSFRIHFL
ncbi:TonB-dependent receptor [Pontimicrobium aquaticum]|uniref:TonB-dependent receptor n=1 Tax=Pontimicrobium aquaticum TaxID=2565367 RepID=A0A4U0EZE3_9FLAO|nr:TonB-dependent receptor [Pontimicrobium aquaticum]